MNFLHSRRVWELHKQLTEYSETPPAIVFRSATSHRCDCTNHILYPEFPNLAKPGTARSDKVLPKAYIPVSVARCWHRVYLNHSGNLPTQTHQIFRTDRSGRTIFSKELQTYSQRLWPAEWLRHPGCTWHFHFRQ